MEKTLNFIVSGLMGDMINSLCACKNICLQQDAKANLYISEGFYGDPFSYGVQKAFEDICDLILYQSYVNDFKILPDNFDEPFINLNKWRLEVHDTFRTKGKYDKCWTKLLSETFDYPIGEYKWIATPSIDHKTKGRIVLHRSQKRHNNAYPNFIKSLTEKPIFITCDIMEYDNFEFKEISDCYLLNTITEMAIAIGSCKMFVGNQSAPFTLASALDVNRVLEVDKIDGVFYLGEEKYSNKISYIK